RERHHRTAELTLGEHGPAGLPGGAEALRRHVVTLGRSPPSVKVASTPIRVRPSPPRAGGGGASGPFGVFRVFRGGQPSSGMASHHWHHHSAPTRMRSFGCQQYEISAVFSR